MKRSLSISSMFVIMVTAASFGLYVAYQHGWMAFAIYAALTFLVLLTPIFLTDLLVTWSELFMIVIGTFVFTVGVSYISVFERLVLILSLPVTLAAANQLEDLILEKTRAIKDQSSKAAKFYEFQLSKAKKYPDMGVQTLLVSWAHAEQFKQTQPKEYYAAIRRINRTLMRAKGEGNHLFYLRNGLFLIMKSDTSEHWRTDLEAVFSRELKKLRFHHEHSQHEIQFQYGYQFVNHENDDRYPSYEDILKRLERLLETDIIVEY
ncbi:hypothetical protein [Streptococcus ferus]|uniref:hypothetical protein n=1 Tax=Streptococcus ferus TaxID=1345 RepID=UPI0035A05F91